MMSHWNYWYSCRTFWCQLIEVDLKGKSVKTPRVTLVYCSEWLRQFLLQALGWFHDGTGRGSLDLPKSAKHKWKNHSKLTQWVF